MDFYAGWIDAFGRNGVTCNEAAAASRQLQSRPPRWGCHLEAILQEIRDKRSVPPVRAKTASAELADARAQSKACPKCKASGWVRSRMRLASYPYRLLLANFFARECSRPVPAVAVHGPREAGRTRLGNLESCYRGEATLGYQA